MKSRIVCIGLALSLVLWTPVVAKKKGAEEKPAFVFGSISGLPGIKHVYIQNLGKVYVGNFNRPKTYVREEGVFYFDKVPPGEYYLAGFSRGGDLFWFRYTKESVQDALFTVEAGGIHYMSSYRIKDVKKKFFSKKGTFDIEPIDTPNEEALLEKLVGSLRGKTWEPKVEARLEELRNGAAPRSSQNPPATEPESRESPGT